MHAGAAFVVTVFNERGAPPHLQRLAAIHTFYIGMPTSGI